MNKSFAAGVIALAAWCCSAAFGAEPHFLKLSDHCYYMAMKESGENLAVVVTEEGILLMNPPQGADLPAAIEALRSVSPEPVRWVLYTEPGLIPKTGAGVFNGQNPLYLAGVHQKALRSKSPDKGEGPADSSLSSWLVFDKQMQLFPANVEIRIIALQNTARSGGDMVVFVPAEKVLFVGALYESARYPDIDTALEGSALGWLDGMKQAIDAVPVLKSAIPQAKLDPKPEKDKRPEELITVLSSRGEPSNLMNMKDLLDASHLLRNEIAKAIKRGRSCDTFLASSVADPFRSYWNLDSFAAQLFTEMKK